MNDDNVNKKNRRLPSTAIMLSLIEPGLGHIYCGRMAKGLMLAFFANLIVPILFGAMSISQSSIRMVVIIGSLFFAVLIVLIAAIDSWYIAKLTPKNYVLKEYNKWYVYLILILMGTGSMIQLTFNVRSTLIEAFRGAGMANYPSIVPNDRFLANKLAYKKTDPKIGDMIVFSNPEKRQQNFIKRVVALAGDTVEIKDNQLYINDQKLERKKLPQSVLDNIRIEYKGEPLEGEVFEEINRDAKYKIFIANKPEGQNFAKITVPLGSCFVLGDNRNLSRDSRHVGPVPIATIKGRADFLYCPAQDWSRFGRIEN